MRKRRYREEKLDLLLYEKRLLEAYALRLDKYEAKKAYRKRDKELLKRESLYLKLKRR